MRLVTSRRFDVVFCDLYLTPISGMELLAATLQQSPDTLVVMMTGNPSVSSSLDAIRAGAWDYLPKPFNASHLQVLMGRAAHTVQLARDSHRSPVQSGASSESGVLGTSPSFRRALELAQRVAATDASVMITGESGTGKEVIANFIHRHSRRVNRPFVPVNCAALPEPLLESELFGHRKGAFTGADRDKPGLLETANGGTFFLDELGEAPLSIQAKLLRVLQDGIVRRVGSEQADATVDVRFISATNRDPHEAMARGVLREDLFYRLGVVPIRLPSLRERAEDIPVLARHFFRAYWARHRGATTRLPAFSDELLDALQRRTWRGNVRELQNVMEFLAVLAEPGATLSAYDVPPEDGRPVAAPAVEPAQSELWLMDFRTAKDALIANFEREYVQRLVARSGANMSRAARLAKMDRTTLYRLMEKHGMSRSDLTDDGEAA
jgi:DNA-binding NtrC family response regulator